MMIKARSVPSDVGTAAEARVFATRLHMFSGCVSGVLSVIYAKIKMMSPRLWRIFVRAESGAAALR
jgi:hypothetical protein